MTTALKIVVVAFGITAAILLSMAVPYLARWYGCRVFKWRGHTVVILRRRLGQVWSPGAVASYTAAGKGWFHFRSMRAFKNVRYRRHEWCHMEQHQKDWLFPFKYVWAHIHKGYERNPYEIEAVAAESRKSAADAK